MSLFIPKKIKVGYQNRSDTYSQKLAYVIYYDTKNKLRKETSWKNWIDKSMGEDDFDNTPMEGFVLNKKVGGYKYHFDVRQTYTRVYDPRGFEVEITIPNLLHILEHTSSIKGKGLEGEFVYAWDGKELVLLPTSSPDYEDLQKKTEILIENNYIKGSELKIGRTYDTVDGKKYVYLGKYPKIKYKVNTWYFPYRDLSIPVEDCYKKTSPQFWFMHNNYIYTFSSVADRFYSCSNEDVHPDFQKYMEILEKDDEYCPIDFENFDIVHYTLEDFKTKMESGNCCRQFCFMDSKDAVRTCYFERKQVPERPNETLFKYYKIYWNGNYDTLEWNDPFRTGLYTAEQLFYHFKPFYIETKLTNGKLYKKEYCL